MGTMELNIKQRKWKIGENNGGGGGDFSGPENGGCVKPENQLHLQCTM